VISALTCRFCAAPLSHVVLDLGMSPLSNALVSKEGIGVPDKRYPLRALVCERCWLVQVPDVETPERIFTDYPYFSSMSTTWNEHGKRFADAIIVRLGLTAESLVVEAASNDGSLLKEFMKRGVATIGIEPARNVAQAARDAGVRTISEFFGSDLGFRLAEEGRAADLLVANNVLAHVPDVNDFVAGIAAVLKPEGVATLEFPHLLKTIERREIDTFYHEHFSYFSLLTAETVFAAHGMTIEDVEELPTHGGSLRIYAVHRGAQRLGGQTASVARIRDAERAAGLDEPRGYASFQGVAQRVKLDLVEFLVDAKRRGKTIAGYGAPAKATTLLNFCAVGTDLLPYTVDKSPHKQGRMIPGVRIPIEPPQRIFETKPDYVLILPWNIADEVREQMAGISAWSGRFVLPLPEPAIVS
jgi:SAM-dependent methyltransferase